MAVPDTTTFSLQDVVDEVITISPHDLQGCFTDANPLYFNLSYYNDGNDLLEFRDYGAHNVELYSTPDHREWTGAQYGSTVSQVFQLTISPDVTFTIKPVGDIIRFTTTSDQSLNTITVFPSLANVGADDYVMVLTVSATGYPDEVITCTQYGNI